MIGPAYVSVSGACIADFGHQVTCVDKDSAKISALNSGEIPIYEPGLKDIVQSNVHQGRLLFTTALGDALPGADAVFIAVGTPSRRGDGHADLSYVYEATREIAAALTDFTVIITKSTVPVGTGDEVERIIRELRPDIDVAVVSNPEFLREGAAIHDFKHPDRIVIGTDDERAKRVLTEIYRPLYLNQAPILYTGRRTAELIKYAANAFLATKITFINEIADLCEKLGADVQEVAQGIGLDKRIGSKFLHAGPGFGGSAFQRMYGRLSRPPKITTCRCGSSKRLKLSTTCESAQWRGRCRPPSLEFYAAKPSPFWASRSSRIPMICVRRLRSR
jgi:UDPglucose 6-dehydrogenase